MPTSLQESIAALRGQGFKTEPTIVSLLRSALRRQFVVREQLTLAYERSDLGKFDPEVRRLLADSDFARGQVNQCVVALDEAGYDGKAFRRAIIQEFEPLD